MATINRDNISRYETTAVYTHPEAEVDIVLVHGLNGRPDQTWTSADGTFWPVDLLPESLRGVPANIMVYGYNADVYVSGLSRLSRRWRRSGDGDHGPSDNLIHQHAQTLVANVTAFRRNDCNKEGERRPLLWVAHSLGGILVKRALLYAHDVENETLRSLYVSTYGIVFLGTPHTGSGAASWALALRRLAAAVVPHRLLRTESVLLRTLRRDNETLANINSHFLDVCGRFRMHMVHENCKMMGRRVTIVDAGSASPQLPGVTYYGVEASHSQMCKFGSAGAPGFRNLAACLGRWCGDAPRVVRLRWAAEERARAVRRQSEMEERMLLAASLPLSPASTFSSASSVLPLPSPGLSTSSASSSPPPYAKEDMAGAGAARQGNPVMVSRDMIEKILHGGLVIVESEETTLEPSMVDV